MPIKAKRLVFIDETWVKTNMAPLGRWGPRGQRVKAFVPFGHWKTMTFRAALRHDRIDAPFVVDGPINGELFRLYVAEVLIPTLEPGDIVVLDNLGSHKGRAVRNAIKAAGAHLMFLPPPLATPPSSAWRGPSPAPPYSPDLNPIEQGFAKLKHMKRKAGERTFENTWRHTGALFDLFSPAECQNYLTSAGYASI